MKAFSSARHRKNAKAPLTPEDAKEEDSRIIDEQEQEKEILDLRMKSRNDNMRAQNFLDIAVLMSIFLTIFQLLSYLRTSQTTLTFLSITRLPFIPLSLTPYYIPPPIRPVTRYHLYFAITQLCFFVAALREIQSRGTWDFGELARWALPVIMATIVEVQRRGENDVLRKLDELEGLKYEAKGA